MAHQSPTFQQLIPHTGHAPGTPLWGEAPQRRHGTPVVILALLTLLVAAPAALSNTGRSNNPIELMRSIADSTYAITGLMQESNEMLGRINTNTAPLRELGVSMASIKASTEGMASKTGALSESLGGIGSSVASSKRTLVGVNAQLDNTAASIGTLGSSMDASRSSTSQVVHEFGRIDASIRSMDAGLRTSIGLMSQSEPQTRRFALNRTRVAIAGGDGRRYGAPNIVPGSSVMSVVLPMINTLQSGGPIVVRKDSARASNPLVGAVLNRQLPNGTNAILIGQPYDGFYGMPGREWFVTNRVAGF
jgi:hypothetical protein